jgi:hypothetical protein
MCPETFIAAKNFLLPKEDAEISRQEIEYITAIGNCGG